MAMQLTHLDEIGTNPKRLPKPFVESKEIEIWM